jgi:hypothetical protein
VAPEVDTMLQREIDKSITIVTALRKTPARNTETDVNRVALPRNALSSDPSGLR